MHPAVVITAALGGVFTLAIISVLVSKNAQFPQVLQQAGSALSGVIQAATSPVTGNVGNAMTTTQAPMATPQIVAP